MGLSERLDNIREEITQEADFAINKLINIANNQVLEMSEIAASLEKVKESLASDTFKLIVVGRFKTGKSSLLNALLGPISYTEPSLLDKGPMPVDDLPTTATLTRINYSEQPYVRVWYTDEDREPEYWSLERYLKDSSIRDDEDETKQFFENIREFELGYPSKICKSVTLLDSPGTSDMPLRTQWTKEAIRRCDAAIVLYRSDALAGQDERDFTREILSSGTRIFTLINLWNDKEVSNRLRSFTWNRLIAENKGGEKYCGQDLSTHDIYFINALKAQQGKFNGNQKLLDESGLQYFENRLAQFLLQEKFHTHIDKFMSQGDILAAQMLEVIETRCCGLQKTKEQLEQTYAEIKPKLEELRKRKSKLSKLIDRYKNLFQAELQVSFARVINNLRNNLPDLFNAHPLECLQGLGNTVIAFFTQKRACEEAAKVCESIITAEIQAWAENPPDKEGVQQILEPMLQQMFNEINVEVTEIENKLQDIRFQMIGYQPGINTPKSTTSLVERIIVAGAGLALGDITLVLGGAGGFRGIVGYFGGALMASVGMGIAMFVGAPITFPVLIIASLIGAITGSVTVTTAGLEQRIKKRVLAQALEKLPQIPELAKDYINKGVVKTFDELKFVIINEVSQAIQQEQQIIEQMILDNQCSSAEKENLIAYLTDTKLQIEDQRKVLVNTKVQAQQLS
jgi:Dynamin family